MTARIRLLQNYLKLAMHIDRCSALPVTSTNPHFQSSRDMQSAEQRNARINDNKWASSGSNRVALDQRWMRGSVRSFCPLGCSRHEAEGPAMYHVVKLTLKAP